MSSQQGPKAAPVQHSAHILLGFILREPQSTTANFLDFVGERYRRGPGGTCRGMPGIGFSIHKLPEAAMPHHASLLGCEFEQMGDMLTIELLFSVCSSG